ncbi:NUMOD4 domain-containing protein [Cytobacillus firmus]|uniref:NUMOD4 domain-containing protein n=1 Tax=Cytobacillus firmus TaxID=1399 RepID=UPI0018CD88A2|nr:NUMOD4 domain-containing protein [Cytobacillus firmus]
MYAYENLSLADMPNEQWKQFHEGKMKNYFVSDCGRIKSVVKSNGKQKIIKQVLKNQAQKDKTPHWRLYIRIRENGTELTKGVSRVVAETFITNSDNLPVVCHNDNEPKNNNVDNLRWGTYKDNSQQALEDGLLLTCPAIVLTRDAEMVGQFDSVKESLLFLNSKRINLPKEICSVGDYVVMKKNYYNELTYDELLHVCQNVNSRGEIKEKAVC